MLKDNNNELQRECLQSNKKLDAKIKAKNQCITLNYEQIHRKLILQIQSLLSNTSKIQKQQKHQKVSRSISKQKNQLQKQDHIYISNHTKIRLKQWLAKLNYHTQNLTWAKNQIFYLQALKQMILSQNIIHPFNNIPPDGPLPKLSLYDIPYPLRDNLYHIYYQHQNQFFENTQNINFINQQNFRSQRNQTNCKSIKSAKSLYKNSIKKQGQYTTRNSTNNNTLLHSIYKMIQNDKQSTYNFQYYVQAPLFSSIKKIDSNTKHIQPTIINKSLNKHSEKKIQAYKKHKRNLSSTENNDQYCFKKLQNQNQIDFNYFQDNNYKKNCVKKLFNQSSNYQKYQNQLFKNKIDSQSLIASKKLAQLEKTIKKKIEKSSSKNQHQKIQKSIQAMKSSMLFLAQHYQQFQGNPEFQKLILSIIEAAGYCGQNFLQLSFKTSKKDKSKEKQTQKNYEDELFHSIKQNSKKQKDNLSKFNFLFSDNYLENIQDEIKNFNNFNQYSKKIKDRFSESGSKNIQFMRYLSKMRNKHNQ